MTTVCPACGKRPPHLPALDVIERSEAPRSAFPVLAFAFVPYTDDAEHGTLYVEVATRFDAEFDEPGVEYLIGGVHRGGFSYRDLVQRRHPSVRLPLAPEDAPAAAGARVRFVGAS